jgi:tripartite-type tricarboxylate transporter receptor subunit TctC
MVGSQGGHRAGSAAVTGIRGGLPCAALVAIAGVGLATATEAFAQSFPSRPVRMIVPQAAGGSTDFIGRFVGQHLAETWGQSVVIDNRPGANANIGMELAARAPKDGYTLLMGGSAPITINPALYAKLPFDTLKDFAPITLIAYSTSVLIVHPTVPAKTIGELIALAKAKPGQLSYASAGAGSTPHLSAELFRQMAGIDILHVPYKGSTPGVVDTMAGRTTLMFTGIASAIPHIKGGRLKALSVNGPGRSPALPDVPTAHESGLPGFEVDFWIGLFVPAGTPAAVIAKIHSDTARFVESRDAAEKLQNQGAAPVGAAPDAFAKVIRSDAAKWAKVVRTANLKVD